MSEIIISIISDIILTIVTGIMAYATYNMANSTKQSVNEMKLTRTEANSAEIVVFIEVEAHRMYLVIKNVGNTVAKNVKIKNKPELINSNNRRINNLKEISYLPPNYTIKTFFDMTHNYYNKFKKYPQNKFFITYENIYGELIEREYESNLNYLNDVHFLSSESETVEMSLYKIRKEITRLRKN